jgi:DNA adenine methylase
MHTEVIIEKKRKIIKVNTPFGYFGSKNKIALELCSILPPHNCWVEAFCGSAALTLRKKPALIEIINDTDDEIINVFKQLRDNHEALYNAIELTPYAEKELINARRPNQKIENNLERARIFLVQAMMSINGVFGEERGGFSYSDSYVRNGHDARVNRWNNLPERLKHVVTRLKGVRIENKDARKLLVRYLYRPATLMYLDPPYFAERTNGYNKDANNEKFHRELLELANKANCMIFISGYENELYTQMLTIRNGWQKRKIETITKDSKGNSHDRTEVLWTNKHFQNALELNRVPIILTEKEQKQGKLNPERKY